MGVVGSIVLIALVIGGVIGWRLLRYPGQWRHAFAEEFEHERRDLDSARERLTSLERDAQRERKTARAGIEAADAAYRRGVRDAEARLAALRDPGRGAPQRELGGLRLYRFTLQVTAGGRHGEYPLDELSIRSDHSAEEAHIYLVLPKGRQQMLTFRREEHPDADVRSFVVDVHNAVADAKRAKAERDALVPQAEAELELAVADTAGQQRAKRTYEQLAARQDADPRIPEARRALEAARDRWVSLTGRRPR